MDETDTLGTEVLGTDNVTPEQTDTVPDYVYYDPEEDTVEDVTPETTDDGIDEPVTDDPETAEDPQEPVADEETAEDEPEYFDLPDGGRVDRDELIKGYQRQADYTRKRQEDSNRAKQVEQNAQRLTALTDNLVEHLSKMIPAAPDASLALSNPNQFTARKAAHDAAMAQVQQLLQVQEGAKNVTQDMTDEQFERQRREESVKLAQMFPEVGQRDKSKAFFGRVSEAAQKVGFSQQEIGSNIDHRMIALAHWADVGMKAEANKAKAKAKVEAAPQAPARKPGQPARQPNRNREAMSRLTKTGSIRDALKVDFD